ncbi:PAS domain S-box protein [Neptunicella sp.]|uniref:PAS domain-containing protein n=1 Tax=Neptunicella sp. TaxID=2125986 RepID=UPI003F692C29
MQNMRIKLLVVENDRVFAKQIKECLGSEQLAIFEMQSAINITDAIKRLNQEYFEVVLLDISSAGSQGLACFETLQLISPRALYVLLCTKTDEPIAHQAILLGASDYIDREEIDVDSLKRILVNSMASRLARDRLRETIAGIKAIGDASSMGIMISNLSGHITYTNHAYHRITGFSEEQLLGLNWVDGVYAGDRLRIQREWRQALQVQQPFKTHARMLRKDNTTRLVHISAAFLHDRKALFGHVRLLEDITAQTTGAEALRVQVKRLVMQT